MDERRRFSMNSPGAAAKQKEGRDKVGDRILGFLDKLRRFSLSISRPRRKMRTLMLLLSLSVIGTAASFTSPLPARLGSTGAVARGQALRMSGGAGEDTKLSAAVARGQALRMSGGAGEDKKLSVGFIGQGIMGVPMAKNLLTAGFELPGEETKLSVGFIGQGIMGVPMAKNLLTAGFEGVMGVPMTNLSSAVASRVIKNKNKNKNKRKKKKKKKNKNKKKKKCALRQGTVWNLSPVACEPAVTVWNRSPAACEPAVAATAGSYPGVTVWNRSPAACEPAGASPAALVAACDVVFAMLSDPPAAAAVGEQSVDPSEGALGSLALVAACGVVFAMLSDPPAAAAVAEQVAAAMLPGTTPRSLALVAACDVVFAMLSDPPGAAAAVGEQSVDPSEALALVAACDVVLVLAMLSDPPAAAAVGKRYVDCSTVDAACSSAIAASNSTAIAAAILHAS
ncbi:hypothetical protein T484DRAFT_1820427 [Baffinella frigidus]|nr:hypothetical protein T484DRAFT_1820427 [Cryptophyta sp. CCMP2293]